MNKKVVGLGLAAVATLGLVACGHRNSTSNVDADAKVKAAIVTDTGGVDDKSFNQSAWEGLQAWGEEQSLTKGSGYTYFQSTSESDYATNLDSAVSGGYNLVFGIGFALHDAVETAASNNTDVNYVLIDDTIEDLDNVASVLFADNEAAYLAGVAAASTTTTNHIGFIGGMTSVTIDRFEAGFVAGAKSVNPDIQIDVNYVGSFGDAATGQTQAAAMYAAGADIIYQAAGGSGTGVIAAAKSENESKNEDQKVWVIGVDRDQSDEGEYTSKDGKSSNFILASTIKEVGTAVQAIANQTLEGSFPGGQTITYGLADDGVDLATTNLSDSAKTAVETAKAAILDGSVTPPETPEK